VTVKNTQAACAQIMRLAGEFSKRKIFLLASVVKMSHPTATSQPFPLPLIQQI